MERALKSLALIRAKHLAESVTTPVLLADGEGNMIFFNEAAEELLGSRFTDVGPQPAEDWQQRFKVRARDDSPFPLEAMPGWIALQGERPGLGHLRFTTLEGADRFIAVCAIPLFAQATQFEGAMILFWQTDES